MMAAILNSAIIVFPGTLTLAEIGSHYLHKKIFSHTSLPTIYSNKLHSFTLTQLDDGSHLEFCHLGFKECYLGFTYLVIFSQIHSKTLSLHSVSDSNWFNLLNLMMAAILNCVILEFSHLSISSQTHTCQDWFPPFAQKKLHSHFLPYHLHKKTSLIYSDLTWWWQPSWILPLWFWPSWIQLS